MADSPPWWQTTTIYQIYPRSFADHDGDGIGDLAGIQAHLDHLSWLGVDAIWLSPIYPSPMADFGYDISDYCDVDPVFGDLDTFDALLEEVHRRDMRLLLDWVPNHTSSAHPWFMDARSGRDAAHRDYYIWRDPAPDGGPPNNWAASLTDAPAWTLDEASGQYYLHLFLPGQPDLNWANPAVESAMHDTLRFWLDRGVDGFRADVVHCIGKDPGLPDDPGEVVGLPHCVLHDEAPTHQLLERIRRLLDGYPQEPMMVGEVYLLDTDRVVKYLGDHDELHLAFNFPPLHLPWDAAGWRAAIERAEAAHLRQHDAWPTWVLSNHDVPRHRTRYERSAPSPLDDRESEEQARAAAVLLLTLRGTPFLYQGEELGLRDAEIPPDRVVDPGGRDGCRAPIPWDATASHGWSNPWLPLPPNPDDRNVATQVADEASIAHLYRSLLALRRRSPSLVDGSLTLLEMPDGVLGYRRELDGSEPFTVLISMTGRVIEGVPSEGSVVVVDSVGISEPGTRFQGRLQARQALVLR